MTEKDARRLLDRIEYVLNWCWLAHDTLSKIDADSDGTYSRSTACGREINALLDVDDNEHGSRPV
jgi:hypothetical protein